MPETKIRDEQLTINTGINGLIESPSIKEYTIVQRAPFGGSLTRLSAKNTNNSGTGTLVVKVNGAAVTFSGGAFNITDDTEVSDTISAGGDFNEGDTVILEVTAQSALVDLSFTLDYTR